MVKFTGSSQNSFDTKFLDRYDNLTFLIKRNTPCYAVSAEWSQPSLFASDLFAFSDNVGGLLSSI